MKLSEPELQELAAQLRCPDENGGLKVAEMMNSTNANIISKAINALSIKNNDTILEIGPGNGKHIEGIINKAKSLNYYGTDISQAMVNECNRRYSAYENVKVTLTDGISLPYPDNYFDIAFTINTIYFWQNPDAYANEISRVTKTGSLLCVGYIPERVMQKIPFAKYGFRHYSEKAVRDLLNNSGFKIHDEFTEKEFVTSNTGRQIEREFVIISGVKD